MISLLIAIAVGIIFGAYIEQYINRNPYELPSMWEDSK